RSTSCRGGALTRPGPRGSPDRSPSAPTLRRSPAARRGRGPSASPGSGRRTDRRRRGAAPRASRAAVALARSRPGSFLGSCPGSCLAAPCPEQVRLDQVVQIAVHNRVDVAPLVAGPVVLDQLVGVERVRADLAAEGDFLLLTGQFAQLLTLLLLGDLVQPRLENAHGRVAIAQLRALVLAR